MNYYERHLGDYAKDTGHLSMLEHGAYSLLLDRYYSTETGIPEAQACRLARARSDEERQAVDAVLEEFFELVDGVWINRRAEEEIAKARVRIDAAKENGRKGGRPRKNQPETQQKPTGFSSGFEMETQTEPVEKLTKHQAPDTSKPFVNQRQQSETGEACETQIAVAAADPVVGRAIELTALLRRRGADLQASDPRVRGWASSGVTDAQALAALERAQEQRAARGSPQPINAGLISAILTDITTQTEGQTHGKPRRSSAADRRAAVVAELTGANRRAAEDQHDPDARTLDGQARVVR